MAQETTVISVQNTFGINPWLVGKVLPNPGHMAIGSAIALAGAATVLGLPAAVVVLVAVANDFVAVARKGSVTIAPPKDVLRLKDGAWSLVGARFAGQLPPAQREIVESVKSPSEVVIDVLSEPTAKTPKPSSDPADRMGFDRQKTAATYPSSPWGNSTSPQSAQDFHPPVPRHIPVHIPVEKLTDFEREIEAQVAERVAAQVAERSNSPQRLDPQGIVNELFVKEDGYFRSWFGMGVTGAGKGVFICYASILAKSHMPGVSIWAIDPKSDPSEYLRWNHIEESQRYHYDACRPAFGKEAENLVKAGISRILEGYANDKSRYKLLIVDELPAILRSLGSSGRSTLRYLNSIASMGRSQNQIVWLFSNSIGLQQNGITQGDQDYYQTLYLATPRKLAQITGYAKFAGPKIESIDPVFSETGRAAWASTKDAWESVPTSYYDVVSRLPPVAAPSTLGTGEFKDSAGAIALANLAEELAEALEEMGLKKGILADLIPKTSFAHLTGKVEDLGPVLSTLTSGLKKYREVLTVRSVRGETIVALPTFTAPPRFADDDDKPISFDFL
jgi:hypothetical protein